MTAIYKRSNRLYYTPAQVTVYLNGYLVDDACAISYEVSDNWTPLWGHNDRLFRRVAEGQTMVMGSLLVRFRYHGYLKRAISAITDEKAKLAGNPDQVAAMRKQQSAQALSDAVLQMDSALVLNYLDAAAEDSEDTFKRASDFLKDRFWGESGAAEHRDVTDAEMNNATGAESQEARDARREYQDYMRPSVVRADGLRLRVVHGPDKNMGKRAFAEVLDRVQFRGKSYQANIEVPDGERICAEVYPFLARELKPI